MTRQRRFALKRIAEGKCPICSEPASCGVYCLAHAVQRREQERQRFKWAKRVLTAKSYALEEQARLKK